MVCSIAARVRNRVDGGLRLVAELHAGEVLEEEDEVDEAERIDEAVLEEIGAPA